MPSVVEAFMAVAGAVRAVGVAAKSSAEDIRDATQAAVEYNDVSSKNSAGGDTGGKGSGESDGGTGGGMTPGSLTMAIQTLAGRR